MIPAPDDDADYAGMTLAEVDRKHKRLRGTDILKYPPTRRERCQTTCGLEDAPDGDYASRRYSEHQCFLRPSHPEPCEFSSECSVMRRQEAVQ